MILTLLIGTLGLATFFLYPDRLGRVIGLAMFGVGAVAFWTELLRSLT